MMFNVAKWFTGFTLIQLKENYVLMNEIDDINRTCPLINVAGMLYANCVGLAKPLKSIPRGLDKSIKILNVSSNPISSLYHDDLSSYTELVELVICSVDVLEVSPDFLAPVQKLTILKMSFTPLYNPVIKLPQTIKILYADFVKSHSASALDLDLSKLTDLEELSLAGNGFQGLPNLNTKAPIVWINLRENQITNMDYTALAPFCKLNRFDIEKFVPGTQYLAKCCGVRLWFNEFSINSELKCDKACVKDENFQFSSDAIDTYNECVKEMENLELWEKMLDILIKIFLPSALIITFFFLVLKYYRSDAVKHHRQTNKRLNDDIEEFEEEEDDDDNKNS